MVVFCTSLYEQRLAILFVTTLAVVAVWNKRYRR